MMASNKYIDIKYTIWQRVHYNNDTDMSKLVDILKENDGDIDYLFDEEVGFLENEVLYDTEEYITPEENKASTIEVYDNSELIYENYNE